MVNSVLRRTCGVLIAAVLTVVSVSVISPAQAAGMQRLATGGSVPIVGSDGHAGPHWDGRRSVGYHGNHGWVPGTACAAGLTITPFGTCVRLKN